MSHNNGLKSLFMINLLFILPYISSSEAQTIDFNIDFGIWNTMYPLENVRNLSVQVDKNNDLFVHGGLFNFPICDAFLLKFDGIDGSNLYSIDFDDKDNSSCSEQSLIVNIDSNNDIIANYLSETAYIIEKYDGLNGDILWSHQLDRNWREDNSLTAIDPFNDALLVIELDYQYKVIKYSGANGAMIWESTIEGINSTSQFYGLSIDSSGNILIIDSAYRLLKLGSSNGQTIWQTYLTPLFPFKTPFLNIDSKNNAVVIYSDLLDESYDIVKLSENEGEIIWQKNFNIPTVDRFGIKETGIDSNDDIFLIGNDQPSSVGSNGFFSVKYSGSNGDQIFTMYNDSLSDYVASDIDINEDIIVSDGIYYFNHNHNNGSIIWKRQLAPYNTPLSDLKSDTNNDLICAGYWSAPIESIVIYKFDPTNSDVPTVDTFAPQTVASCRSGSAANLKGAINPNGNVTNYWFEFSLGNSSVQETTIYEITPSDKTIMVSEWVRNLVPEGVYSYQLKASNLLGETSGEQIEFKAIPEKHRCECFPCMIQK